MISHALSLRPINDDDLSLLNVWLHKPYILQWYEARKPG